MPVFVAVTASRRNSETRSVRIGIGGAARRCFASLRISGEPNLGGLALSRIFRSWIHCGRFHVLTPPRVRVWTRSWIVGEVVLVTAAYVAFSRLGIASIDVSPFLAGFVAVSALAFASIHLGYIGSDGLGVFWPLIGTATLGAFLAWSVLAGRGSILLPWSPIWRSLP